VLRARGLKSGGFGIKDWTGDRLLGRYADLSVRDKANDEEVFAGLMQIVEEKKPEFIVVQYGETDEVFHRHGPSSGEARAACGRADAWLARVVPWLRSRGYAIIITADHGQHDVQNKHWRNQRPTWIGQRHRLPRATGVAAQRRLIGEGGRSSRGWPGWMRSALPKRAGGGI
jgi:predicted AlkP superfamily pyrophosphatase or phosphodiesterase